MKKLSCLKGFGLLHQYPVSKSKGSLENVLNCLKGSDSALRRVCTSLGLELKPKVVYSEEDALILMDKFTQLPDEVDRGLEYLLGDEKNYGPKYNGSIIRSRGLKEHGAGEYEGENNDGQEVWWLTKRTELTREGSYFIAFGNEASIAHTYGDVVLIAKVGGHANRRVGTSQSTRGRKE